MYFFFHSQVIENQLTFKTFTGRMFKGALSDLFISYLSAIYEIF